MALMVFSDTRLSRLFLTVYCAATTLFCLHFVHLAKQYSLTCSQSFVSAQRDQTKPSEFPRKIWQTSKTSAAGLEDHDRKAIQSWMKLNHKHRYEIVTQHSGESFVRDRFPDRHDILEVFADLQDPILRADFIRYLLLLGDGGVYSDMDVRLPSRFLSFEHPCPLIKMHLQQLR